MLYAVCQPKAKSVYTKISEYQMNDWGTNRVTYTVQDTKTTVLNLFSLYCYTGVKKGVKNAKIMTSWQS